MAVHYALLIFALILPILSGKSITITWSTPENIIKPATGLETLKAIEAHLRALHLANTIPSLFGLKERIEIKLCPPQPFDPLVREFTVPRLSGYTLLYDHECIQMNQEHGMQTKWGSTPKQPETPKTPPSQFYGERGLTVPAFVMELFLHVQKQSATNKIWLIDSDSLRGWMTAPILNYLAAGSHGNTILPADLMRQLNAMYGNLGETDLKNMPQAIQGALLIILPDYSTWKREFNFKSLFNPTWWSTRYIPRTKKEIVRLCIDIIKGSRKSDQLVIIHHEPTPFNFEIISDLTAIYGEKVVISSTRVLPKSFTTIQMLQFIQKAAGLVLDSRDTLGQIALLSVGMTDRVISAQSLLPRTLYERILFAVLIIWLLAIALTTTLYTHKHYTAPLHIHAKQLALFTILALTPIFVLNPVMWPKFVSMIIFSLFESGYELIVYAVVVFYAVAGFITVIVVAVDRYNKSKNTVRNEEDLSINEEQVDDTESIQLIAK